MNSDVISIVLDRIAAGGPLTGWMLTVYLLLRIHQLTDRQHKANLATARTLSAIKAILFAHGAPLFGDED